MTVLEALKSSDVLSGDMWCRPVGETGYAYAVRHGQIGRVPSSAGFSDMLFLHVTDLTGSWEIVSPEKVTVEYETALRAL